MKLKYLLLATSVIAVFSCATVSAQSSLDGDYDTNTRATQNPNLGRTGDPSSPELGIFRVWSFPTHITDGSGLWNAEYSLTDSAQKIAADFDIAKDRITVNCEAKGMPTLMEQPYPIAFIRANGSIMLQIEEYDTIRVIRMGADKGDPLAHLGHQSNLGYSVGHWEGKTLVITTTDISWRHFNGMGVPISGEAEIVERFTPSDDGSQLDFSMTVTDPQTFLEPVTLNRSRLWYPDIKIGAYDCND